MVDKETVLEHLRMLFAYYRDAVADIPLASMHFERPFFGTNVEIQQILFIISTDQHEHLGQAIAYARSNRIVPPWSR